MSGSDAVLRIILTAAHKLLKATWFVRRPRTQGAHAVALTRERKLIMVRLRYARGWRLPGGGRRPGEYAQAAVIRELREEIGMTAYGRIRFACELEESIDFKRDLAALLIVEDVRYRSRRWSWEIEAVGEFEIEHLPSDTAGLTLRWLDALRPNL
ncbi:MAG TPA: NUDIX domain-containing protein [Sphingomicrobium sp.]|jgi:8-oxo-dGTP pyrophosphatase MutT (NUDIX family)|nr:NUDIX domain-containing protein [Sphingomicrobium sp.]